MSEDYRKGYRDGFKDGYDQAKKDNSYINYPGLPYSPIVGSPYAGTVTLGGQHTVFANNTGMTAETISAYKIRDPGYIS